MQTRVLFAKLIGQLVNFAGHFGGRGGALFLESEDYIIVAVYLGIGLSGIVDHGDIRNVGKTDIAHALQGEENRIFQRLHGIILPHYLHDMPGFSFLNITRRHGKVLSFKDIAHCLSRDHVV